MSTCRIGVKKRFGMAALVLAASLIELPAQLVRGQESKVVPPLHAKAGRPPATRPKANPAPTPQPKLVRLAITKCDDCDTTLRKRIAVMPVKVGTLSQELDLTVESVSERLRGELEQAVPKQNGLVALDRAELDAALEVQSLGQRNVTSQEPPPSPARFIPAHYMLFVTLGPVDVGIQSERETTDDSAEYENQASEKEQGATGDDQSAENIAASLQNVESELQGLYEERNRVEAMCANNPGTGIQGWTVAIECVGAARATNTAISNKEAEQASLVAAIEASHQAAQQKRDEAQDLHNKARLESEKDQTETRTTTVTADLAWRIVETPFGTVVASGTTSHSDSSKEEGVLVKISSTPSEKSSSPRYDALADSVIAQAADKLATEVGDHIRNEPFRAKIVRVDLKGVTLNCGSTLGAAEGDAFGVREKKEILTDPDTGLPLEKPGPPIGLIRVSEVFENTAFAQVVKATGPLKRGDELIWVGMYNVPGSK